MEPAERNFSGGTNLKFTLCNCFSLNLTEETLSV